MIRAFLHSIHLDLLEARTARAFRAWRRALNRQDVQEAVRLDRKVLRLIEKRERVLARAVSLITEGRSA